MLGVEHLVEVQVVAVAHVLREVELGALFRHHALAVRGRAVAHRAGARFLAGRVGHRTFLR